MDRSKYPPDWEEIARAVKDEAGWKCEWCGQPHDTSSGRTILTVHHLDRNPANCERSNLVALCAVCHLRDEAKARRREAEKNQFKLAI